jgi:hemerythrin-like domain-containing protein
MSKPIEQLNEQHQNIAKLLHLLEHEIDRVAGEDTPNVSLLLDIMQYLTRYVDVAHHPLEELLIARYEEKEAPENEEVKECKRQHKELVALGREFMAVVEAVREEQLVERVEFERIGRNFVEAQLAHIDLEEGKVFPTLKKTLDDEEMESVAAEMASRRDPLFGGIVEKEYSQLYDYIIRSS